MNVTTKNPIKAACFFACVLIPGALTAGEGGVAGSAAFDITATAVNSATMAGAVGKDTAYAGSNASGDASAVLDSFAAGTGGVITFAAGNNYISSIAEDANRAVVQANDLGIGVFVDFDAINGTADINNQ